MAFSTKSIRIIVYYLSPIVIYGLLIALINFVDEQFKILRNLGVWAPVICITVFLLFAIFIAINSNSKKKHDLLITFANSLAFFLVIFIALLFDEGYKHDAFKAFFSNGFIYVDLAIFIVSFIFSSSNFRAKNIAKGE